MQITVIIPARYQSTRFPGKPLAKIKGRPMIEHVYQRCSQMAAVDRVIVATDDRRIYDCVHKFGGEVQLTAADHKSGTDRIAEVARKLAGELIVNVQGDEPLVSESMVDSALQPFASEPELKMSTLKKKITDTGKINDPDTVKVVCDSQDYALYFSRSPLPFYRQESEGSSNVCCYQHLGLYVYRRDFLLKFTELEPTPLECAESLEQLRALENGYRIKVVETDCQAIGVDRPEDISRVEKELLNDEKNKTGNSIS